MPSLGAGFAQDSLQLFMTLSVPCAGESSLGISALGAKGVPAHICTRSMGLTGSSSITLTDA